MNSAQLEPAASEAAPNSLRRKFSKLVQEQLWFLFPLASHFGHLLMRRCSLCQLLLEVEAPARWRNSRSPHSSNSRSSSVRLKLANYCHLLLEVVGLLLPVVVVLLLVVVAFHLLVVVAPCRLVVALLLMVAVEMNHHQTWDAPAAKGLDLEHPSSEAAQPKLRQAH